MAEKERMWVIVVDTDVYVYKGDELNYQYVLYTRFLLEKAR